MGKRPIPRTDAVSYTHLHLNAISSRVAGTVKAVYVENGQPVKAGQTLVDLDPSDYEVLVAQARADYEQAIAQAAAESPNVPITVTSNQATVDTDVQQVVNAEAAIASAQRDYDSNSAKQRQAEANNRKAQSDLVRYKKLVDQGEISLSDYDQYVSNAGGDEAAVEASRYAAASSEQIVEEKKTILRQQQTKHSEDKANLPRQLAAHKATVDSRKASVDSAKAQLDTALLNLSYCHIVAPVDGIASQRSEMCIRDSLKAARLQLKAASEAHRASKAEYLPSLEVKGDYGIEGINPNKGVSVFQAAATVTIPIFQSGRVKADVEQADAALSPVSYTHLDVYKRQSLFC